MVLPGAILDPRDKAMNIFQRGSICCCCFILQCFQWGGGQTNNENM